MQDIARLRKKLGLTQTELADRSGVSQSLIARLEARAVDPRYSKVARIFEAFEGMGSKQIHASQIVTKDVVGIQKEASIEYAASKMREHGVSQMPVMDGDSIIGSFSEGIILDMISKGFSSKSLPKEDVGEHMGPAFPLISPETPISVVSAILEHNSAVMVAQHGKTVGIITKADLLKVISL